MVGQIVPQAAYLELRLLQLVIVSAVDLIQGLALQKLFVPGEQAANI